jgi:hypothetical protein
MMLRTRRQPLPALFLTLASAQLVRSGGGPEGPGGQRRHRLRLGDLALVEHVELLVDPLPGVEGVGGDGPDQHRGGGLVQARAPQREGGGCGRAEQGDGGDQGELAPEHRQAVAQLHRSRRHWLFPHRGDCPFVNDTAALWLARRPVVSAAGAAN